MALSLHQYTRSYDNPTFHHILKQRIREEQKRSSLITITIEDGLPECLIIEILSWLPVKSLLQFKSVCKLWYSIISTPHFISKHLENYYDHQELCLLVQFYVGNGKIELTELLVNETLKVLASQTLHDLPFYSSFACGPCDGLYYVYRSGVHDRALWNPAMNKLKLLPSLIKKPDLSPNLTYTTFDTFGFGVDPNTKDYKVVVIQSYRIKVDSKYISSSHPSSVFVYSLRADSWTYCGDLSENYEWMKRNKCHVFVNGCCYWLCFEDKLDVAISFDMVTNEFQEFQVPHYDRVTHKRLGIYDDSLALFTFHIFGRRFDLWTFNDGIWSKKFSSGPFYEIMDVIGHWKGNKVFLQRNDLKLILYDPASEEMEDLGFQSEHFEGVFDYKESLVSINDENRRGHRKEDETNA